MTPVRSWAAVPWVTLLAACTGSDPVAPKPARDWVAPVLSVVAPERGAILGTATRVDVRGTVADSGGGIATLTVNDAPVAVAADGSFATTVAVVPGITLIHTRAVDGAGNDRSETRAVLAGDLVPVETTVPAGVAVRLDPRMLAAVAALGAKTLDGVDLGAIAQAKNPVLDLPTPCLGARVEIRAVQKGAAAVSLVPVDGGLELDSSVADLSITVHVAWDVACRNGEADIVLSASRFRLAGTLGLGMDADGQAALDATQTTAAFDDFRWGGDLLPAGVQDFLSAPLGAALGAFLQEQVAKQLSAVVAGRLRGADQTLGVGSRHLVVALRPQLLRVDATGIYAVMDSRAYLDGAPGTMFPSRPAGGSGPSIDGQTQSFGLVLTEDALNEVLASLWGAGVLDRATNVDPDKLQELGSVFDRVEVNARLPPVAETLADGSGLRITMADLETRFEMQKGDAPATLAGRVAVSLRATFTAHVTAGHLSVTTSAPELDLDVAPDDGDGPVALNEDSLRAFGGFVTDTVVGLLNDALASVPLPGAAGLDLVDAEITTDAGHLVIRAGVAPTR
jgi:hypothetical protein